MRPVLGRNAVRPQCGEPHSLWANNPRVLKTVANTSRGRSSRGRGQRRSRRQGGDSVGKYFGDAWSLAKRTAVGLNEIRKLINVEHKFVDTNLTTNTSINGATNYLCPVAQGNDYTNRQGDSIRVQSIDFIGTLYRNTSSTANESYRVLIIRDLMNMGADPTVSDILETVGTQYAPFQHADMLNGQWYNKRYTILFDQLFTLDTYHPTHTVRFHSDHPCHVAFKGTGSTTASAGAGAYFLVTVTSASVNVSNMDFSCRVIFTDN